MGRPSMWKAVIETDVILVSSVMLLGVLISRWALLPSCAHLCT